TNPAFLLPFILHVEGGHVNDPDDRGGETNKGVTIATWKVYGNHKPLKEITDADVLHVLTQGYWNRFKADEINDQAVANSCVDWVWGSGVHGITNVQSLIGASVDGIVGPETLSKINRYDPIQLLQKIYDF